MNKQNNQNQNQNINILIVDDDMNIRETLQDILVEEGYKVQGVDTKAHAQEALKNKFFNIALADLKLPDGTAFDLLDFIKKNSPHTSMIIITAYASLDSAIQALNGGVFSYFTKPFNIEQVRVVIKKALEEQRLTIENERLLKELAQTNERLNQLALIDTQTEVYNWRYLRERLSSEFKRAKRQLVPLSFLMIDIDYFKSINDVYGHRFGDMVLQQFAKLLKELARGSDIVTRYRGEEFVVILPDTSKEGAVSLAKRFQENIHAHQFGMPTSTAKLTISIGVISYPEDGIVSELELLDLIDKIMITAKEKGSGSIQTLTPAIKKQTIMPQISEDKAEQIRQLKNKILDLTKKIDKNLLESIYAFAKAIEARDFYTGEHVEKTVFYATELAKSLGLPEAEVENIRRAAVLHDIGKIGISDKILLKEGKLTPEEYDAIKKHPLIGADILRPIHFLRDVVPIILYHHERYDGFGYSSGLKGEDIPLGARIVAVADAYQALISDRPYRKAYSQEEALEIIKQGAGTYFDPKVVELFLQIVTREK